MFKLPAPPVFTMTAPPPLPFSDTQSIIEYLFQLNKNKNKNCLGYAAAPASSTTTAAKTSYTLITAIFVILLIIIFLILILNCLVKYNFVSQVFKKVFKVLTGGERKKLYSIEVPVSKCAQTTTTTKNTSISNIYEKVLDFSTMLDAYNHLTRQQAKVVANPGDYTSSYNFYHSILSTKSNEYCTINI